jgi:succinoglycan biosynthesis transport protein ExoP
MDGYLGGQNFKSGHKIMSNSPKVLRSSPSQILRIQSQKRIDVPVRIEPPRPSPNGSVGRDTKSVDLRDLALTLWRGKWLILAAVVLSMTAAGLYTSFVATPLYRASAVVMLETREEQVVDLEGVMSGLSGDAVTINSEVEVLRSRELLSQVVEHLSLTEDPEFNTALIAPGWAQSAQDYVRAWLGDQFGLSPTQTEALTSPELAVEHTMTRTLNRLLQQVEIGVIPQSVVFRITVETTSATKSAAIANAISGHYILEQLEVKFDATEQATTWLSERLSGLQSELEERQSTLAEFSSGSELVSPETLEGLNRQLKDTRDRLIEIEVEQAELIDRHAELSALWEDDRGFTEVADDRLLSQLMARRVPVAESSAMAEEIAARMQAVLAQVESEISRAELQITALTAAIAPFEQQIAVQSAELVTLEQLEREVAASDLIYETFLNRFQETSVQQGIQQADSRVLSRAVVPLLAASPQRKLMLTLAAGLGLLLGAAWVVLRENLKNTYRTAEELEAATGRSVLGQIPLVPATKRMGVLRYLAEKPASPAAEAVRNLRTSLLLSNPDRPPQIIMSTSSLPGEGKTTQSIALAQNMAAMGKRVLLIEGDVRRQVFGAYFQLPAARGLLAVISGEVVLADAVQSHPTHGFDILMGEQGKVNPADVFGSVRFAALLEMARRNYDFVIIDTPPVLVVPDARVIGQLVDTVIYAVHWDKTHRHSVAEGLRLLESVNVPVSGMVLSQIDPVGMKKYGYAATYGAYGKAAAAYLEQ